MRSLAQRPGLARVVALGSMGSLLMLWAWLLVGPPGSGCTPASAGSAIEPPVQLHPDVLWGGCQAVKRPAADGVPICVFDRSPESSEAPRLQLWLPDDLDRAHLSLDGEVVELTQRSRPSGGTFFEVEIPHEGRLDVFDAPGDRGAARVFSVHLQLRPTPFPELARGFDEAVRTQTLPEYAQALTERLERQPGPEERIHLLDHLRLARYMQGDYAAGAAGAEQLARAAHERGWLLLACTGTWVAAFTHGDQLGQPDQSRRLLEGDTCPSEPGQPAVVRAFGEYYRGILDYWSGRLARATTRFQTALQISERMDRAKDQKAMLDALIHAYAGQGRFSRADALVERFKALRVDDTWLDCELRAHYEDQRGQLAARRWQAGSPSAWTPQQAWHQAIKAYQSCPETPRAIQHVTMLRRAIARAWLDQGDPHTARATLRDLATPDPETLPLRWQQARLLDAELALAAGDLSVAVEILDRVESHLQDPSHRQHATYETRWRYHLLRAHALEHQGHPAAAIEPLRRAERVLGEAMSELSAPLERDRYAAMYRKSGAALVRVLRATGDDEAALCAARTARARGPLAHEGPTPHATVIVHAENGDCSGLPEPGEDEVALLLHRDGPRWVGFAWRRGQHPMVADLPPWQPDDPLPVLASALLVPFDDVLAGATRLRVLATGPASAVNFAALPRAGRPLIADMAVSHALDLPPPPPAPRVHSPRALAVLAAIRLRVGKHEPSFDRWVEHLVNAGVEVDTHKRIALTGEPIGRQHLLQRAQGRDLLLLLGTGRAPDDPDPDDWGIELDDDALLSPTHVYFDQDPPRRAILATCDSGVTDPLGSSGASGLAQRFVLAGSEWVMGTTTQVDETTARAVVDRLTQADPARLSANDAAAVLRTVLDERRQAGDPDAYVFRLWVP